MKNILRVLATLVALMLYTNGYADGSVYVVSVPDGETGVISGQLEYTLVGHVHASVYRAGFGEVAWIYYYQNFGVGGGSESWNGISQQYGSPAEGTISWSVTGLPPGDYFVTYGAGEPQFGATTDQYPNPLVDLLFYFYGMDLNNIINPANVALGTVLVQMQSQSFATTYSGDLAPLVNPSLSGWY